MAELARNNDLERAEWVQPKHIVKMYSMGRTTVWRLLKKMKAVPKYEHSFRDVTFCLKLVKLADFEDFMQSQDKKYLREV